MDALLPDTDTFHLCDAIRGYSGAGIIFLYREYDEDAVIKGIMTGGDGYLIKPFDMRELEARIYALIRRVDYINDTGDDKVQFDEKNRVITVDARRSV